MLRDISIGGTCLAAGLIIGFWGSNSLNRNAAQSGPDAFASQANVTQTELSGSQPTSGLQPNIGEVLSAAEQQPDNFVTQMKAGDLYAQIGKFDKAIEFYKKGISLRPNDVQANLVLANAYFDAGQFDDAGGVYTRVLEADPKNIAARTDLGTTFVERPQPDFDRAIKEFKNVLEAEPANEAALYNLAVAYSRKGDQNLAKDTLAALEKAKPTSELIAKLRQKIGAN